MSPSLSLCLLNQTVDPYEGVQVYPLSPYISTTKGDTSEETLYIFFPSNVGPANLDTLTDCSRKSLFFLLSIQALTHALSTPLPKDLCKQIQEESSSSSGSSSSSSSSSTTILPNEFLCSEEAHSSAWCSVSLILNIYIYKYIYVYI